MFGLDVLTAIAIMSVPASLAIGYLVGRFAIPACFESDDHN